jgi:hypothetical protein
LRTFREDVIPDMLVKLYELPAAEAEIGKMQKRGVDIRGG